MTKQKVSFDVAAAEVGKWLEAKEITERKQERFKEAIEIMIEGVEYGRLAFDFDSMKITQHLSVPVTDADGNSVLKELVYKPRLTVAELQSKTKAETDGSSRLVTVTAALTGQPLGMIGKLDTSDNSYAQSISVFFL
jgi:hypothetical protein